MPPASAFVPPWMKGTPMESIFTEAWIETGDVGMALDEVRRSNFYSEYFAGNVREDGSIRYDENTYLSMIESFEDSLLSINVNPDLFQGQFEGLIAGGVSPSEFAGRIENVHQRVIDATPQVAERLNTYYGMGLTTSAIIASFLDPDVGTAILEKRIAVSEVGAEASKRRFNVSLDLANRMYEAGTDTASEAAQFFSLAEGTIPVLQTLAARHDDPDDDFTLEQFAAGEIFGDPAMRRRVRTLLAQERASFNQSGETSLIRSQGGGVAGLAAS